MDLEVRTHPILRHSFILILLAHHRVLRLVMRLGSHLHVGLIVNRLRAHAAWMWLVLDIILILLRMCTAINSSINVIIRIRSLRVRSYLLELRFYLLILLRHIPVSLSYHYRQISRLLLIHSSIHSHLRMILERRLLSRKLILNRGTRYELWRIQIKVLILLLLLLLLSVIHKSWLGIDWSRRMRYVG